VGRGRAAHRSVPRHELTAGVVWRHRRASVQLAKRS
jgi:hypothetical protein